MAPLLRESLKRTAFSLAIAATTFGAFTLADRLGHGLAALITVIVVAIAIQSFVSAVRDAERRNQ